MQYDPPPAHSCTQGRWRKRERHRDDLIPAREIALQFAIACRRGGGANGVKKQEKSTSGMLLHAREVGDVNGIEI